MRHLSTLPRKELAGMRVIAGSARGVRLESPRDSEVRPTLDRVREAIFNILGEAIPDAAFLDLFAGTGAMGIEALSRGAARAVFVDHAPDHLALIERNLAKTKLANRGRTLRLSIPERLGSIGGTFDLVYADPPRSFSDYQTLIASIVSAGLLAESGRLILESPRGVELKEAIKGVTPSDTRTYGDTRLTLFA